MDGDSASGTMKQGYGLQRMCVERSLHVAPASESER